MRSIHVLRKPCSEPTVAANVIRHGTGALNIDATRIGETGGTRRDGRATRPTAAGWANMKGHSVAEIDAGRWPTNVVVLDECECELDCRFFKRVGR